MTVILIDAAVLHNLLQLGGNALAQQLPLGAAGHGNDAVPVCHGTDGPGGTAHSLAKLGRKIIQPAHEGILFEDDLAIPAGIDLQRITVTDNIGTKDLVRTHFCALDDGNG